MMRSGLLMIVATIALSIQTATRDAHGPAGIAVDRETRVTRLPGVKMGETVVAANPRDADNLVGAAVAWLNGAGRRAVVAYVSEDGGSSWRQSLTTAGTFFDAADEWLACAPDGTVYLVTLASAGPEASFQMAIYRSDNSGGDWLLASRTTTAITCDRPFAIVDRETSALFINAVGLTVASAGSDVLEGPGIFVSRNRGSSVEFAYFQPLPHPATVFFGGNAAISPAGTMFAVYNAINDVRSIEKPGAWGQYTIQDNLDGHVGLLRWSRSGADPSIVVAPLRQPFMPFEGRGPSIAISPSSGPFGSRLHVVWPNREGGRTRIQSAFSVDVGNTWSMPRAVDDAPAALSQQPNNFMAMVAVNLEGIVGVMWYDRRDDPMNLGWSIRFGASRDGGETWMPSVRVSSQPNVFDEDGFLSTSSPASGVTIVLDDRQFYAADTVGMTAAADGSFHPFWVDNRTGVPQVWTARVRVQR